MQSAVDGIVREFAVRRLAGQYPTLADAKLMLHDQLFKSCGQEVKPQDTTRRGRDLCDELRRFVSEQCTGCDIVNIIADHTDRTGGLPLTSVITEEARRLLERDSTVSRDDYLVTVVSAMLVCRIFDQLDARASRCALSR